MANRNAKMLIKTKMQYQDISPEMAKFFITHHSKIKIRKD
jgi:hypothetical protein